MEKRFIAHLVVIALASSLMAMPAYAVDTIKTESFDQELAELLQDDDRSNFFGEITVTIGSNSLLVDGEKQPLDAAPVVVNNRTMVPIRAIAEAAGAEVDYDADNQAAIITSAYGDEIICPIGANEIRINEETYELDTSSFVSNGRTYLPLRATAESLELEVEWDPSGTVTLTAPYQSSRVLLMSDSVDVGSLRPVKTLNDGNGLCVLQFATPAEAKEAVEVLQSKGYNAEPDYYIPPTNEYEISSFSAYAHNSWGAPACGFDSFLSTNYAKLAGEAVVAVVDTGVDNTHPFLRSKVLNSGYDFVSGDTDPKDENSHGTFVAGIVVDCVGNAPVQILPVRVLGADGSGMCSAVAAGIRYSALHQADVINLSLGGGHCESIDSAVSYAIDHGCIVCVAAGNEGVLTDHACPAHITTAGTLVVSAGDTSHKKASFSNYGASVDVIAPGVSIKSCIPNNSYATAGGTSAATPFVSAAAALLDLAWNKSLPPAELEAKVRGATTYGSWHNRDVGCGFLDMTKASVPAELIIPGIKLSKQSLSLIQGDQNKLVASVVPKDAAVQWRSNNTDVVSVDATGVVYAKGEGNATVTASMTVGGKIYSATCEVQVSKPNITLSKSSLNLMIGDSELLAASVTGKSAVTWKSSDSAVVIVDDNGLVTATGNGAATVVAEAIIGGKSYTAACVVRVTVPSISLSKSSLLMTAGDKASITATSSIGTALFTWTSSDASVVTVTKSGTIEALRQGNAEIRAEMEYRGQKYSATCYVTVEQAKENSDWTTTPLPQKAGYTIETKQQFRFRSKETITSNQEDLPGWILYDKSTEYGDWGSWSEWQSGVGGGMGDGIQVENRTVETGRTQYYNLYYYKYWNSNEGKWYYTYSASYALARGGSKYTVTAKADECSLYNNYDGYQAYKYNGHPLWWIESSYHSITYSQQYRTREREISTVYSYYRWTEWSDWKDVGAQNTELVEVEVRTLYRYKAC